jgi:putative endonuclease
MSDPWSVYIIRCHDGTLYCGATNNVPKRIDAHNKGKGAKYTKTRLPVLLVYKAVFETKSEALKREYAIKQLSRKQKEQLIDEGRK